MNLVYVKFYGFFPALIAELLESDLALKSVLGEDSPTLNSVSYILSIPSSILLSFIF